MKIIKILCTLCILLTLFPSCEQFSKDLLRVSEKIMDTDPQRALSILDSINFENFKTKKLKAKHALLYSIALDKNFIDMTTDSILSPAVNYYRKYGSINERMYTNYYLGRIHFNAGNFPAAAVTFLDAKRYAKAINNLKYLGLIAMAMADTYNNQFNTEEEIKEIEKASEYFLKGGYQSYKLIADYRLAVALRNNKEYDKAEEIYTRVYNEAIEANDSLLIPEILKSAAGYFVTKPSGNPTIAMSIYKELAKLGHTDFGVRELGEMAYTFTLMGNHDKADQIMQSISADQESFYYAYIINRHRKNFDEAFIKIEDSLEYLKDLVTETLEESAIKAQRDYYEVEKLKTEIKIKNQRYFMTLLFILILTSITILILLYILYEERITADKNAIMQISEKAMFLLNENKALKDIRQKVIKQFKSQFALLKDICDTYTFYENRNDLERKMQDKIQGIINMVRSQSGKQSELERIIDKELNGAMATLRSVMVTFHEEDFIIISYFIAGFDANLISRLMNMSIEKVYQKKSRLSNRIISASKQHNYPYLERIILFIKG